MSFPSTISGLLPRLSQLSPQGKTILREALIENINRHEPYRRLYGYYPDRGPYRRELYPRHMAFFMAGGQHEPIAPWCPDGCDGSPHRERLALCANRVGKTLGMGGYELTLHLTGRYPDWWPGYRFNRPIEAWAAGKTNETTRDIIQRETLFGAVSWRGRTKSFSGDRLIPREDIGVISWKRGIADFADTVAVKSQFGGWSTLGLKSYEQGRGSFEGTAKDVIWYDEEMPLPIYSEGSLRLMTRCGLAMLTFTPMEGMSHVVQAFLPGGRLPGETDW